MRTRDTKECERWVGHTWYDCVKFWHFCLFGDFRTTREFFQSLESPSVSKIIITITDEELQILPDARHMWPLSS